MEPVNRDLMRAINQFNILNTIRIFESISRVEIAKMTGQSRASVTNITSSLIKDKLIYEKDVNHTPAIGRGSKQSRGRRRVLLSLNPDAAFVVGVKLSAFRICCAVANMQGNVKSSVVMPARLMGRTVEFVADLIEDSIRQCVRQAGLKLNRISGIGIGIPGFVDSRTGVCFWTPLNQKGLFPLKDMIQKRFDIATQVDNDTNTVTLAHQWFGEGKGIDNFLVVSFEEGLGMGIVVNGQLFRGANGIAGELAHVVVDPHGERCYCGNHGCLGAYVGTAVIVSKAQEAVKQGKWKREGEADITYDEIISTARAGEPVAKNLLEQTGHFLGLGLVDLVHVFNPTKIIITGNGVKAGDLVFDAMYRIIQERINDDFGQTTEIIIPPWQHIDWAQGAASLVLQELYRSPFNRIRPVI